MKPRIFDNRLPSASMREGSLRSPRAQRPIVALAVWRRSGTRAWVEVSTGWWDGERTSGAIYRYDAFFRVRGATLNHETLASFGIEHVAVLDLPAFRTPDPAVKALRATR